MEDQLVKNSNTIITNNLKSTILNSSTNEINNTLNIKSDLLNNKNVNSIGASGLTASTNNHNNSAHKVSSFFSKIESLVSNNNSTPSNPNKTTQSSTSTAVSSSSNAQSSQIENNKSNNSNFNQQRLYMQTPNMIPIQSNTQQPFNPQANIQQQPQQMQQLPHPYNQPQYQQQMYQPIPPPLPPGVPPNITQPNAANPSSAAVPNQLVNQQMPNPMMSQYPAQMNFQNFYYPPQPQGYYQMPPQNMYPPPPPMGVAPNQQPQIPPNNYPPLNNQIYKPPHPPGTNLMAGQMPPHAPNQYNNDFNNTSQQTNNTKSTNGPTTPTKGKKQKSDKTSTKKLTSNGGSNTNLNGLSSDDSRMSASSPHQNETTNEQHNNNKKGNKSNDNTPTKKQTKPRANKKSNHNDSLINNSESGKTVNNSNNINHDYLNSNSQDSSSTSSSNALINNIHSSSSPSSSTTSTNNTDSINNKNQTNNCTKPQTKSYDLDKLIDDVVSAVSDSKDEPESNNKDDVKANEEKESEIINTNSTTSNNTKAKAKNSSSSSSTTTFSSNSPASSSSSAPSPVPFNINNILSNNRPPSQPNTMAVTNPANIESTSSTPGPASQSLFNQSQMLPPPSPSNGSTSSSTSTSSFNKIVNSTTTNAPSPSSSSSASTSNNNTSVPSSYGLPYSQYQPWKQPLDRPPSALTPDTSHKQNQANPTTPNLNNNHSSVQHQPSFTNTDNSNLSFSHGEHDDEDNTSMTSDEPSSPKMSSSMSHHSASNKNADIIAKLADMGSGDEQRKDFLSKLHKIWEDYSIQCRSMPNISKQTLDLYKLYLLVKEKGGFNEVTQKKLWKDIAIILNISSSTSAAFNVRKKYVSLGVFHYECKFDLNGLDPLPIILEMEKQASNERNKKSSNKNNNNSSLILHNEASNQSNSNNNVFRPSTPTSSSNSTNNNPGSAKKKKQNKDKNTKNVNSNNNSNSNGNISNQQIPTASASPSLNNSNNPPPAMVPNNFQQQMHHPNFNNNDTANQQFQSTPPNFQQQNPNNYYQPRPPHYQNFPPQTNQQLPQPQLGPQPNMIASGVYQSQPPTQQQPQQIQRIYNPSVDMYNQQFNQQQQPVRYPPAPPPPQQQQQQQPPNVYNPHQQMMPPPPNYNYNTTQQPGQSQIVNNSTTSQQQPQVQPHQQQPHQQQQQQTPIPNTISQRSSSTDDVNKLINNTNQTPPTAIVTQNTTNSILASKLSSNSNNSTNQQRVIAPQQQLKPSPFQQQITSNQQHVSSHPNTHNLQHLPYLQTKKEISFPIDSVEASIPAEIKKRKITAKDIAPCDPWKLYMSLKSGLLAESTWAMDALNILLYDDSTIAYFHLKHFPGMLYILLEHYLKCLKLVFNKENGNEFYGLFANNYPFDDDDDDDDYDEDEDEKYDSEIEFDQDNEHIVNNNNNNNSNSNKLNNNHNNRHFDNFNIELEDDDDYSDSNEPNDPKSVNNHYNNKNSDNKNKKINGYCNNNHDPSESKSKYSKMVASNLKLRGKKVKDQHQNSKLINTDIYDKYKHLFEDDLKVMRINFNDCDTLNRFLHYYKSFKFNDSKVCEYWCKYNENIIEKMKSSSNNNKKPKLKNINYERILSVKKREKKELNNYILTNFSTKNDLTSLNKLFYGRYYEAVKLEQKINKRFNCRKEKLLINANDNNNNSNKRSENTNDTEIERLKKLNSEFIKRHQTNSSSLANNETSKFSAYGNSNISSSSSSSSSKKLYDDQITTDDETVFKLVNQSDVELMNRLICLSTIFRNLSFVPGNDVEMCKSQLLLKILARLIIIKHTHHIKLLNKNKSDMHLVNCSNNNNQDEIKNSENLNIDDVDVNDNNSEFLFSQDDYLDNEFECMREMSRKNILYEINSKSLPVGDEWWWDCVQILRENTLVTIANISSNINLNTYDEDVIQLFSHGLLHWSICKSNDAQDTLSNLNETSLLSPQRLSIEALSKMTINDDNVDLLLTSIFNMRSYLETFINLLCSDWLVRRDDQTLREFSVVLITALAKCDQIASRLIAQNCSFLLSFIEDFEEQTRRIAASNPNLVIPPSYYINNILSNQNILNNDSNSNINEEHLGTTIEMLRRCSNCIMFLSAHNENIPYIMKHENRLLDLTTSQYVDYKVSQTLAEVLFYCSSKMNETMMRNK